MSKLISKSDFMEKLNFYLSFYFNDDESKNIVNDYEEWFENETLHGKTDREICAALDEPKRIVKKLFAESNHKLYQAFFHNSVIEVLLLTAMHLFAGLYLLKICDTSSLNYFPFLIGINFIYFFIGFLRIPKACRPKSYDHKSNLTLLGLFLLIVFIEFYVLPKISYPDSGMICVSAIRILLSALFAMNLYLTVKKFRKEKLFGFLTLFHISGMITVLLFLINQLHMLYSDPSDFKYLALGSVAIYTEVFILSTILYKTKTAKE